MIVKVAEPVGFRRVPSVVIERGASVEIHHDNCDDAFHQMEGSNPRELSPSGDVSRDWVYPEPAFRVVVESTLNCRPTGAANDSYGDDDP